MNACQVFVDDYVVPLALVTFCLGAAWGIWIAPLFLDLKERIKDGD